MTGAVSQDAVQDLPAAQTSASPSPRPLRGPASRWVRAPSPARIVVAQVLSVEHNPEEC